MMPQWDFLDFLAEEARHYPTFALRMEAEAVDLRHRESGRVAGVRLEDGEEVRARLTIAADGRSSVLRDKAGLPKKDLGAPIDVLWFRLPKEKTPANETGGTFGAGTLGRRDRPRRLLAVRLCCSERRGGRDPGARASRHSAPTSLVPRRNSRRVVDTLKTGTR